jgi:hypothetical protein
MSINVVQSIVNRRPTSVVVADRDLGWRFSGERNQQELGLGDFVLRFDSYGCRGVDRPAGSVHGRTLFLGNSVTLGQQVPEDQTFAALLGGINAGGDAYDSYQQILHLRRDLMGLEPRRVVLMVVGIDLMTAAASRERQIATAAANPDLAPWWRRLTDVRAARQSLRRGFRAPAKDQPDDAGRDNVYLAAATVVPAADVWRDWTGAVAGLAADLGPGRLVIVLSPPRAQVRAWRAGNRDHALGDEIARFCSTRGLVFCDVLPDLAEHDPGMLYGDHVHFTVDGHLAIAQAIRRAGIE